MPTFECAVCGYTCGSAKAWQRHAARSGAEHVLNDPSLAAQATAAVSADGLSSTDFARSLRSWHRSVEAESSGAIASKVTLSLEHDNLPLVAAARRGNLAKLRELLPAEASELARTDSAGMTALAWASKVGNLEAVELLLEAGASPDLGLLPPPPPTTTAAAGSAASDDDEAPAASEAQPPLYLALTKGHAAVALRLLDARADPCEVEPVRGQCALHAAASGAAADDDVLCRLLLSLAASTVGAPAAAAAAADAADAAAATDADAAADAGGAPPPTCLVAPLSADCVALPADFEGFTPLHAAAANGRLAAVEALLRAPRVSAAHELDRRSSKRVTPLAAACRRRHADVARALVGGFGAAVDALAMRLCLQKKQGALLVELLELATTRAAASGGDASAAGGATAGAAQAAAEAPLGSAGVGAGVDGHSGDGMTALMLSVEEGDAEAVAALLTMGADPSAADGDGHTPLHRAAFFGAAKLVNALIEARASVDAVDAHGNTALHHAGRGSQEHVFDLLELRHGADTELTNDKGEVPKLSAEPCRLQ